MDEPSVSSRNDMSEGELLDAISDLETRGRAEVQRRNVNLAQFEALVSKLEETAGSANLGAPTLIFSDCLFFNLTLSSTSTFGVLVCDDCQFTGATRFVNVTFGGSVFFRSSVFFGPFNLNGCHFKQVCSFEKASFDDFVMVAAAEVGGNIAPRQTQFDSECSFSNATFSQDVQLRNVSVGSRITFSGAKFRDTLAITDLTLESLSPEGYGADYDRPCACSFYLSEFGGPSEIQVRAVAPHCIHEVSFRRSIGNRGLFFTGDNLRLNLSQMLLPMGGSFAAKSATNQPTCVSVEDVAQTSLDGVSFDSLDLTNCELSRAASLASLRLEGSINFPTLGSGFTSRSVIADELNGEVSEFGRFEATYRSLRSAVESSGDFPGAADFYFGEMEMRRRKRATPLLERFLLGLYKAVSGYGTRPLRAFTTLLTFVLVAGLIFDSSGAVNSTLEGGDNGWLVVMKSATSFGVPAPNGQSNLVDSLYVLTKVVGVTLFGLWVVALRSRVRR